MFNYKIPRQSDEKRLFWLDIIRGHASSGLSVQAWCRQKGISTSVFYGWRKQLQDQPQRIASGPEQPRFVEVVAERHSIPEPVRANAALVVYLGQARIEVPAGFDPATLRIVLKTLGGGPC